MFGFGLIEIMLFKSILAAILAAAAVCAIAYFAVKLTINVLKKYKKKKASKLVMANMGSLIKNIPDKDKRTYSFYDLEKLENETVVAEYDEEKDEMIQCNFADHTEKWDDTLDSALKKNDGIILIKD